MDPITHETSDKQSAPKSLTRQALCRHQPACLDGYVPYVWQSGRLGLWGRACICSWLPVESEAYKVAREGLVGCVDGNRGERGIRKICPKPAQ